MFWSVSSGTRFAAFPSLLFTSCALSNAVSNTREGCEESPYVGFNPLKRSLRCKHRFCFRACHAWALSRSAISSGCVKSGQPVKRASSGLGWAAHTRAPKPETRSAHAKTGGGLLADEPYAWKENSKQQSFAAWDIQDTVERGWTGDTKHEAGNVFTA